MSTKCAASLAAVMALALASVAPVLAQGREAEATQFEPLTVTAPVSPMDRSLELLRLLVEQTTPCLGCDRVPARNAVLDYLLASEPPLVTQDQLLLLDIKVKDSPELEFLRP